MNPGAVFGKESRGDVRIVRNGYFAKVSKMAQVVLVGIQNILVENGGAGRASPQKKSWLRRSFFVLASSPRTPRHGYLNYSKRLQKINPILQWGKTGCP